MREREREREWWLRREREGKCTFGIPRLPGNAITQAHELTHTHTHMCRLAGRKETVARVRRDGPSHPLPAKREG